MIVTKMIWYFFESVFKLLFSVSGDSALEWTERAFQDKIKLTFDDDIRFIPLAKCPQFTQFFIHIHTKKVFSFHHVWIFHCFNVSFHMFLSNKGVSDVRNKSFYFYSFSLENLSIENRKVIEDEITDQRMHEILVDWFLDFLNSYWSKIALCF